MKVLVIAEHDNVIIKESTLNVIMAAKKISKNIDIFLSGYNIKNIANIFSKINEISKILLYDDKKFEFFLTENIVEQIFLISKKYSHILIAATSYGKSILPRLAAKLNVNQISEITEIINYYTFKRLIYAGNIESIVKSNDYIKLITIRTTVFNKVKYQNKKLNSKIKIMDIMNYKFKNSKFISKNINTIDKPNLNTAKIIVAGGMGIGSIENFKILELFANKLNAAVGATRSAVDAGYISNDCQIGQSGQIVAPKLYIAIGISGAIQHIAGIKDAKTIIAINKDKDAPIFSISNYGIIGNFIDILPKIIDKIN